MTDYPTHSQPLTAARTRIILNPNAPAPTWPEFTVQVCDSDKDFAEAPAHKLVYCAVRDSRSLLTKEELAAEIQKQIQQIFVSGNPVAGPEASLDIDLHIKPIYEMGLQHAHSHGMNPIVRKLGMGAAVWGKRSSNCYDVGDVLTVMETLHAMRKAIAEFDVSANATPPEEVELLMRNRLAVATTAMERVRNDRARRTYVTMFSARPVPKHANELRAFDLNGRQIIRSANPQIGERPIRIDLEGAHVGAGLTLNIHDAACLLSLFPEQFIQQSEPGIL